MSTLSLSKILSTNPFDEEFFHYQEMLSKLIDDLPTIVITPGHDKNLLLKQLIDQNKIYAKKVIDLFEELSKEFSQSHSQSHRSLSNKNKG